MRTLPDPLLGRPCLAYNVQIVLSEATRLRLGEVQDLIAHQLIHPMWRCPRTSLHVSVTPMLSVRSDYEGRKNSIWEENRARWLDQLGRASGVIRGWKLRYATLRFTPSAIIAVAEDEGLTNALRRALAFPESAGMTLVHSTLFRFETAAEFPPDTERRLEEIPISIEERVAEIAVVKETIYPSVETSLIQRYRI